jgi:hypothetical protein
VSLAVAILVVSAALAKSKRPPLYDAKASAKADIDAAIQTHLPKQTTEDLFFSISTGRLLAPLEAPVCGAARRTM